MLNIRSFSWYQNGLSWAYVCERLVNAFDDMGHNTLVLSTNGLNEKAFKEKNKMLRSVLELQKFGPGRAAIDLDWCYTLPPNFGQRFLANSKAKCVLYNYETTVWPQEWKRFYHLVDYYFPSSNFSAEIFVKNGVAPHKVFVVPHGVDQKVFNAKAPKIKLNTEKSFRFVSVCAPHARKNLELLLTAYCEAFSAADDVCLILKTKIYKHGDGAWHQTKNINGRKAFEIVIGDIFKKLHDRFGKNIPEIELLSGHVDNVASIYNSAHCNITTTGAEGFYLPGIESLSCGLLNIAPNYSSHLDFLNKNNSLLIDVKMRPALAVEQYWGFSPEGQIGQPSKEHAIELMIKAYREHGSLMEKFRPEMKKVVDRYSWDAAAQTMIDATQGKIEHYIPGTYNWWPK